MPLGQQRWLVGRAAGEVGHGQVEESNQAAQHFLQGHVFAEWHQLLLEVGALAFAETGDRIVIANLPTLVGLSHRHAGDQRTVAVTGEAIHHADIALGHVLEHRDRRFRPDQNVDPLGTETEVTVQRQLRVELGRVPFQVLLDVALHGGDRKAAACGAGPVVILQRQAGEPGAQQQEQGADVARFVRPQALQVDDQRCRQGDDEG